MARRRPRRPQTNNPNDFGASLNNFAEMIDGLITRGTMSQIGAGLPDDQYARVLGAFDNLQAGMERMRRVLTTARMLREQLMGNREPEASAYIIEDDIRLVIHRGDTNMAKASGVCAILDEGGSWNHLCGITSRETSVTR